MFGFLRFIAGLFIGTIFLVGVGAAGYILFEEYGLLQRLIIIAIAIVLVLNITAFTSFPRSINIGLVTPQIALLMGVGFFYSSEQFKFYFSDDSAYRSCVGNSEHEQGIKDCTLLLNKLEKTGRISLKEIENTQGDYWIAEMLSYRGRHYIRNKQLDLGKADFARALFIPEGVAVTVNNLAEAGFTRSDLFNSDYEITLSSMSENARCMASSARLDKQDEAVKFSSAVSSKTQDAIRFCQLTTGREETDCDVIVNKRIRSIISLSNRIYAEATDKELKYDFAQCLIKP